MSNRCCKQKISILVADKEIWCLFLQTLQTCLSAIITNPASIVVFGVAICFTVSLWHPLNDCREVSSTQQWILQTNIYSLSTSKLSLMSTCIPINNLPARNSNSVLEINVYLNSTRVAHITNAYWAKALRLWFSKAAIPASFS